MADLLPATSNTIPQVSGICRNLFLRKMRGTIPVNFWQEAKSLTQIAVPVFLGQLMMFLTSIVSAIFCGHLGKIELDAVSLATAFINVSGISVGAGLSLACDTLMSQTYGSKNLKRIGVILQRGILILLIACFPCWALFINTENILLVFKQSPEVAKLTNLYVLIFIPALPAVFLYHLEIRYLQNQGITMPQVFTGALVNVLNAVINYLLLNIFSLGVKGSAAANVVSQYCQAIFLFIYIRWRKLHVNTWTEWSSDCMQEWGLFVRLAIPSMLMLCIEWWSYEVGAFLAGIIDEVELGAQCVVYQILVAVYMIPLGYGVAAAVCVGNALGAGNPEKAINITKATLWCTGILALVISVILESIHDVIGYIFTNDEEIIHLVGKLLPIVAANQLFDSLACVNGGVLRGTGKQKLGAIGNLVGFYLIGFPIGISLMFAAKFGIIEVHSGNIAVITVGDATPAENYVNIGQMREEISASKMNVQDQLSVKQLIFRRGLAILSALLILGIGLLLKYYRFQ
ncbi:multidrug and toxin extrusion protein 1-like [Hemiscyllium ocellatum]|uniref:multidrug and toxin extrusion protein 1-like n=1 Tax=Hemiscyllium ocellatum TaxID=170820 RepID=UPI002967407D|nr:multidrug and toxin extrusion protein 1-like [Hemiscyllium ocellatum]